MSTTIMKRLLKLLQKYEERTAPEFHPGSNVRRIRHWYKLTLYSDGSGRVHDSCSGGDELFTFNNIDELEKELKK